MSLYQDTALMREMGWTYQELLAAPEEVVWAALCILSDEGEKLERETKRHR